MKGKEGNRSDLIRLFNRKHTGILAKVESFRVVLRNLRYEGKVSLGKNMRGIRLHVRYFETVLKQHMKAEEKILYPFFDEHVPKYDSVIMLFRTEHHEIDKRIRVMTALLRNYSAVNRKDFGWWFDEFYTAGMYFICLIKHHLSSESASLFKPAVSCLHADEMNMLERQMQKFPS